MPETDSYSLVLLQSEYKEKLPLYEKLCVELLKQLTELLTGVGIVTPLPIERRVKSWNSIVDKIERHQLRTKKLEEVPDIAGLRIVLLFKRDLDKVCNIVEGNFEVLQKEDTQERLGEDQFGYGSIHYNIRPKESWYALPTLRHLKGLKAELQVRTASQHIWASASHVLQYKREADAPAPLRRTINRAAALLETVDLEFERVLSERQGYIQNIAEIDQDEPLNTDSLRRILNELLPPDNRKETEPFAEVLDDLRHFNIATVRDLRVLLDEYGDYIRKEESRRVQQELANLKARREVTGTSADRIRRGVYFTHVGLLRKALRGKFGTDFTDYLLGKVGVRGKASRKSRVRRKKHK